MITTLSGCYSGKRNWFLFVFTLLILLLAGCGGGGGGSSAPTLTSISVTPATSTIPLGTSHQFTATGHYSDGSTQDLTGTASWSSTNLVVATINASGLAASVAQGTTTIRAESGTISGTTTLTVGPPVLASIAITPVNPVLNYRGATQQFTATGTYTDNSIQDLTSAATWNSSNTAVATVSASGFSSAVAITGSTAIDASVGTIAGTTNLTVRTATVSGQISFPDSDMGWKPNLYDYASYAGAKVRVQGTDIVADVVPTSATTGTFTIPGVPWGSVTLLFEEGASFDVFTPPSRRVIVNATADTINGVEFSFVYHWKNLPGYPPPWHNPSYDIWQPFFVSDQIGFLSFLNRGVSPFVHELWRTTNGGAQWQQIGEWVYGTAAAIPEGYEQWMYFSDANHGVMGASVGIPPAPYTVYVPTGLLRTADGGATWTYVDLPNVAASGSDPGGNGRVTIVRYADIDANNWIACGTENIGTYMGSGTPGYVTIWETADSGETWDIGLSWREDYGTCSALEANAAGRAILFDTPYAFGGLRLRVLRDPSGTWSASPSNDLVTNSGYGGADVPMVGNTAWVRAQQFQDAATVVDQGLWRSDDAGATWAKISSALPLYMDFASILKGFGIGNMYVTYDGGTSWRTQAVGGSLCCHTNNIWAFDTTHAIWHETGVGDPNGQADIFTFVEPWLANVEIVPQGQLADVNVVVGTNNVPMAAYQLVNQGPVPINVNSLMLHASGTGQDFSDVTAVMLWWDKDANGAVDAADALLATSTYDANDGAVNLVVGSAYTLQQFIPMNLLVTYDFSPAIIVAKTFRFSLRMSDVSAQTQDTASVVIPTAPTGFVMTSRTVTVSP